MIKRQQRIFSLLLLFSILMIILMGRLASIQLVQGKELAREAVKQRAQKVVLNHNRGSILDRHGNSLLGGEESKVLAVFPGLLARSESNIREEVLASIPQANVKSYPFIAIDSLSPAEAEYFQDYQESGLIVATAYSRYGQDALATHLTGHIGAADGEGKVGLERYYNRELHGYPHTLAAVVDGKHRLVDGLGFRIWQDEQQTAPSDLVLTIDKRIQQQVEAVMDRQIVQGAVVVLDPQNGEILAMASRPNYYQIELPRILSNQTEYQSYLDAKPFINRGVLSYPPASIFKIVVAAAAFESGYSLLDRFNCPGYIQLGDRLFHCSQGRGHGDLDLVDAFAHSCNTVFIKLALELGKDKLYDYARKMGLGEKIGLPLGSEDGAEELAGLLPSPVELPYTGDLALMALGQGSLEATPLQVARLTAVVANGGYLVKPRLVLGLQDKGGRLSPSTLFPSSPTRVISPLTANRLSFLMMNVVDQGTGKNAQSEQMILGGKTGTAETGKTDAQGNPQYYSWFSGLVPLVETRAVITIFMEEPQRNSAGVFKEIAEAIEPFL